MLRLMLLLGAGAYIYSLGHNSAVAAPDAAAKPSPVATVAQAGLGWVAREVHEQTAWAAEKPAGAPVATAAVQAGLRPALPQTLAAIFAEPAPEPASPAQAAGLRRGLQVIVEPEPAIAVASR